MPVDAIVRGGNAYAHASKINSAANIASQLFAVKVLARTWRRDMHNLFDFEAAAENVNIQTFECNAPCGVQLFTRNGHDIHCHTDAADSAEHLVQVALAPQGLSIDRSRKRTRSQSCWLLCRGARRHKLAENDILKFGRAQFRVRVLIAASSSDKVAIPMQDDAGRGPSEAA